MVRRDWALLVVAAAKGEPLSPVQLQKTLFVIGRKLDPKGAFYNFIPYDYGPFAGEVYDDVRSLVHDGLAVAEPTYYGYTQYRITEAGTSAAANVRESVDAHVANFVDRIVTWARGLSFSELVRSVYQAYPEMKVNSIFRD